LNNYSEKLYAASKSYPTDFDNTNMVPYLE